MHEVSLVESIVALVEEERRKQAFSRVHSIRLHVGALGCVEPDALKFCFRAVTRGTIADGAILDIEMIPGMGFCAGCERTVAMSERFDSCPHCGSMQLRVTAGSELRLAEMEVV